MDLKFKTGHIFIGSVSLLLISAGLLMAQQELPMEKIFLRTDRDLYLAGEQILFKIHTLDATSQTPVHYSEIVYLELLDRQHSPIIRKKFALRKGESNGAILLPLEMKSEYYYLRAYTGWMKNAGASGFAYQFLTVINPFEEIRPEMISPEHDEKFSEQQKSVLPEMKILAGLENKSFGRRQKIMLEISFTLVTPIGIAKTVPDTSQQTASTTISVNNGQTAVIGGLLRESYNVEKSKIPILGDIPLLGLLFSSETKSKAKKEVILFITPTIVVD